VAAPLTGIRVVELSSWMAAPSAAAVLADLGADVIKVEPPGGDPARGLARQPRPTPGRPDLDYSFQVDNRGKRSIAIAVNRPEGADVVRRLVATSDVFLCNLLHHRQQRYGLDAPSLQQINPRLVHATLTGYGPNGPDASRPGFDVTAFFGRGAITDSMIEPGGVAPNPRPAQGDHATAIALVAAVLAALRLVEQTGEGQVVDVSLLGMAAWTMGTDLAAPLIDGRQPMRRDRLHLITALANRFRCADDRWLVLNMPEGHWWRRFCETVGDPAWLDDPRFGSTKARYDNMPDLTALIDEKFATLPLAEWAPILDDAGMIWGPVSTVAELAGDPQAAAVGLFPEVHHPDGTFRTVGAPFRLAGADVGPRGPAPDLGQHTHELLESIGFPAGEVSELLASGVVAVGPKDAGGRR
jgi:crotonobetainyl-CoA:carnitine CoA-transferase CaiB-like acyl-CoA transferase